MSSGSSVRESLKLAVIGSTFRAGVLRSLIRKEFTLASPEEADLIFVDMGTPDAIMLIRQYAGGDRKVVAMMDADEALEMGSGVLETGVDAILYAPFRSEQVHALVRQFFLPETVEAEVEDSFRALRVAVAHHVLNALTPIKLKSTSLLRRIRSGETIPPGELEETLTRFLRAVERVEGFIRDLEKTQARDRETYHGQEDMIRVPRKNGTP